MVDTSRAKWDLSADEKTAIKWLEHHGFDVTLEKQWVSKTRFSISKNGVNDTFDLPHGCKHFNVDQYMEQYRKSFSVLCELKKLRERASGLHLI